jgi:hypothetical protein
MAIFARKKEVKKRGIPNLPELPEMPELPDLDKTEGSDFSDMDQMEPSSYDNFEETEDIKNLPSFPDSKFGDSLSQEAVKSAIEPPKRKRLTMEIPSHDFDFQRKPSKTEKEDLYDLTPQKDIPKPRPLIIPKLEMPMPPKIQYSQNIVPQNIAPKKINEPIYVRIDKFKFALDGFKNIKEKVIEIEKYLQEIKEQKRREDEELGAWENEIEAIKLRIEAIDNKIFSKL